MKLLMIFHIAPFPPKFGPSKRNLPFFLEALKRHDVSVLSFGTPEDEKNFRERFGAQCRNIVFVNNRRPRIVNLLLRISYFLRMKSSVHQMHSKRMQAELDALLARERFDLIHCCTTILGFHSLPKNIPLIGDMHNVEYDNLYRAYTQTKNLFLKLYLYIEHRLLKREEVWATSKFDTVITMTERDRQIISAELPNIRVAIIPHGVDAEFFVPPAVQEEARSIVFIGLMRYYPNHHGVLYFLDEIFPLIRAKEPRAKVYIVGAWPSNKIVRRANESIVVTGWVDDVKPYMAKGEVFIIPLRIGGGMRGKALEAMAMRRPIVTTTLGCEGINLNHEESALFADTPEAFAESVLRMFNDAALRERLTAQAYNNVVEGYTWDTHGESLNTLYKMLVPSNGAGAKPAAQASPMRLQNAR
jgi:glycosyltransferase involved in cell wall biosynthesis